MPDPNITALLERYGRTYAEEAGIRLADRPAPLYQLLVLAGTAGPARVGRGRAARCSPAAGAVRLPPARPAGSAHRPARAPRHRCGVPTVLGRRYDAFCWFDETGPVHPLHLPRVDLREPQTYPPACEVPGRWVPKALWAP